MENKRRLIRLEISDFLEIRPLHEPAARVKATSRDITPMGICFVAEMKWQRGQVLLIDYFIAQEVDSVKLKMVVVWAEFISSQQGYFCGGQIISIEEGKEDKFTNYYLQKLEERAS